MLSQGNTFIQVASTALPAGSYAAVGSASVSENGKFADGDSVTSVSCQLRNNGNYMGGADARVNVNEGDSAESSLSLNGGAYDPSGGTISLWCLSQDGAGQAAGQIMITQIAGFF